MEQEADPVPDSRADQKGKGIVTNSNERVKVKLRESVWRFMLKNDGSPRRKLS